MPLLARVVVRGASTVDESMLTGESRPLHKAVGDAVTAGTANQMGTLTVRASERRQRAGSTLTRS